MWILSVGCDGVCDEVLVDYDEFVVVVAVVVVAVVAVVVVVVVVGSE